MQALRLVLSTVAAVVIAATTAPASSVVTVDLGTLPSLPTELLLANGLDDNGTPSADGYYTGGTVNYGTQAGSGGAPEFIYEFTSDQDFNIYGTADGPWVNFSNVDIYYGTPSSPGGLAVAGDFFCGCGPGEGGFSTTTINETWVFDPFSLAPFTLVTGNIDLAAGSYFVELSDPVYPSWQNGPDGQDGEPNGTLLEVDPVGGGDDPPPPPVNTPEPSYLGFFAIGAVGMVRMRNRAAGVGRVGNRVG